MSKLVEQLRALAGSYVLDTFQMRGALMEAAAVIEIQDQELRHVRAERNELAQKVRLQFEQAMRRGDFRG